MTRWHALLVAGVAALVCTASVVAQPSHLPLAVERAALRADSRALQRLLTPQAIARLNDAARSELLSTLIVTGNVDALMAAVRAGLDPNQVLSVDADDQTALTTPLNLAIGAEVDSAVALRLIYLGANVRATARDDAPPLHSAIAVGRHDLLEPLLARGADPNAGDMLVGATALMLLFRMERNAQRFKPAARTLLAHGANVNAVAATGHTALMFAAQAGDAPAVQWLIDQGADWRSATNDGSTALTLAQRQTMVDTSCVVALLTALNSKAKETP